MPVALLLASSVALFYFWFGHSLLTRLRSPAAADVPAQVIAGISFYSVVLLTGAALIFAASKVQARRARVVSVLGCLLLLALLIRFPFFFDSVIDGDESTFTLMGQDILDGYLPYTHLWDVKPPLLFAYFAALLSVSNSLIVVRIGGLLAVAFCAYFVFKIVNDRWDETAAVLAAVMAIVYASTLSSSQATMGEHVLLIPLSGLLFISLKERLTRLKCFALGLLLALSVLIRTNVIFILPGVLLIAYWSARNNGARVVISRMAITVLGFILPFIIVGLIYYFSGNLQLLIKSAVLAPLALPYVMDAREGVSQVRGFIELFANSFWGPNILIWIGLIVGLVIVWRNERTRQQALILCTLLLLMTLSIIAMSAVHGHYLIHLIPFAALLGGVGLATLLKGKYRFHLAGVCLICLLMPLRPVAAQYLVIWRRAQAHHSLQSDLGYQLADYLRNKGAGGNYMFVCSGPPHIVYWLVKAKPATKYADPSSFEHEVMMKTLGNDQTTFESELMGTIRRAPLFILKEGDCFDDERRRQILADELSAHYRLDTKIETVEVYKRISSQE